MPIPRRLRAALAALGATALAIGAAGCAGSPAKSSAADSTTPITLTVTTFGTFGYDALYKQYEKLHPNITIKANNIDTGDNARTDAFTKLAAGSGLSDVLAVEEGWLGAVMKVSDQFQDLRDYGIGKRTNDWVDWKVKQATDTSGRIIGYGTDIGPEGLCYNRKAFAAAGLPTDRAAVAAKLGGGSATWQQYFDLGAQYRAKTGKAWYDQSGFLWNAMVNQLPEGYYTKDGKLNVEGNTALQQRWGWISDAVKNGLSANQTQWDWNKGKSFVNEDFATFVCPGWMLGVVKGQTEAGGGNAQTGWDFADVFPGGAANWGGSFLTVPKQSQHPAEAAALADWLTKPAQQVKQFDAAGTFPSTTAAQTQLASSAAPNAFFNDAPVGRILASRAKGVVAQFKGPDDSVIQSKVFGPELIALDGGKVDGQQGWTKAIALLKQVVEDN